MTNKEMYFRCENCGALCKSDATYCSSCGESFAKFNNDSVIEADEFVADGVTFKAAKEYMQVKTERFLDVFKKNKDKKLFISLNLPALFISSYWMLYRKMYKHFALFLLLDFAVALVVALIVYLCTFSIRNEIAELSVIVAEALGTSDYSTSDIYSIMGSHGYEVMTLFQLQRQIKIIFNVCYWISCFVVRLGVGLFADCLYRQQVVNGVLKRKKGGVSWFSALAYLAFVIGANWLLNVI